MIRALANVHVNRLCKEQNALNAREGIIHFILLISLDVKRANAIQAVLCMEIVTNGMENVSAAHTLQESIVTGYREALCTIHHCTIFQLKWKME